MKKAISLAIFFLNLVFLAGTSQAQQKNKMNISPTSVFEFKPENRPVETKFESSPSLDSDSNSKLGPKKSLNLKQFDKSKFLTLPQGNEGGHGGDPYAAEFFIIGKISGAFLVELHQDISVLSSISGVSFLKVVEQSRIVSASSEDMILNGYEVGAINFPSSQIIKVNSKIWRRLNLEQKIQLVLHEYLGLMSIELDTYTVSAGLRDWTHKLSQHIASEPYFKNFNVNMFFGNCSAAVALGQAVTCDQTSANFAKATMCAEAQAETFCRLSGNKKCEQISFEAKELIDSKLIGFRQCVIEVIMK